MGLQARISQEDGIDDRIIINDADDSVTHSINDRHKP